MTTFYDWLKEQDDEESIPGAFASFALLYEKTKTLEGHKEWANWLTRLPAETAVIEGFNIAWEKFQEETAEE